MDELVGNSEVINGKNSVKWLMIKITKTFL
jgi:hypothetical protein